MNIGVLGGGQLGKMLAEAASSLGHTCIFLDPSPEACAKEHGTHIVGAFDDDACLQELALQCDVVTYEFENLPLQSVKQIARTTTVYPSIEALRVTQDRLLEKEFCQILDVPCAKYMSVPTPDAVREAAKTLGYPCILKTRRLGYDGKGQVFLRSQDDLPRAIELATKQECIMEQYVDFLQECSIICTRGKDGSIVTYPLTDNTHQDGILRLSHAPAQVHADTVTQAKDIAKKALKEFAYVGTLAVELFVLADGSLVVNEFAPRVHNSGHWTIEGATTSQFSNHIRAIAGMELGEAESQSYSAMINIIGTVPDLGSIRAQDGVHIHLYGKSERPGRKIGHITVVSNEEDTVQAQSKNIAKLCGMRI